MTVLAPEAAPDSAPPGSAPPGETSVAPDARRIWRAARAPLLIAGLVVVAAVVTVLLRAPSQGGALDPASFDPSGSHALATLLRDQGVRVDVVRTVGDAQRAVHADGAATLLVTQPDVLPPEQLTALRRETAALVLVAPHQATVGAVLPSVRPVDQTRAVDRAPHCALPAAVAAGNATMGGLLYQVSGTPDVQRCYPDGGAAALVQGGSAGTTVTVLGTDAPLTNGALADSGNAALAMRLLGQYPRLVWYLPSPDDPALRGGQRSFYDLVPAGWWFGLTEATVAVALLALWRARRLGPVVVEPLPVVVRAAETVEGRARLYRRARAAGHAATALRRAALDRLLPRLGLATAADPASVVDMVARRTGRPPAAVTALLYGPPPADDAALVRLVDALDALENEVSRT